MSKEIIEIVETAEEINEFEVKADKGPTLKQLKKIERDYSDIFKEDSEEEEQDAVFLSKKDLDGIKRISKYIENIRMGNSLTSNEYANVRARDDDDDVRELDCDFDGESRSRGRRMFDD